MTDIRRGEVWLVDFGVPVGREGGYQRPAVVVSSDMLNGGPGEVVVVVPATTTPRGLPLHVEIEPGESGLSEISYATVEDVRSISAARLVSRVGTVPTEVLHRLETVLRYVLEL